jgi:hypothetical protein
MSRGIQVFKQTDVTKAIKGAQNAALDVCRFEIDRAGKIALVSASTEAPWPLSKDNSVAVLSVLGAGLALALGLAGAGFTGAAASASPRASGSKASTSVIAPMTGAQQTGGLR